MLPATRQPQSYSVVISAEGGRKPVMLMAGLVNPAIGFPRQPALCNVHSPLQPALAVREIFIAGIFSEFALEGGDDSSGVFLGAPVGARHEDHPEVSRAAWGDRLGVERPVVAQVVGDHGAAFGPG